MPERIEGVKAAIREWVTDASAPEEELYDRRARLNSMLKQIIERIEFIPHAYPFEMHDDEGKAVQEHGTIAIHFRHGELVRYLGVNTSQTEAAKRELARSEQEESDEEFLASLASLEDRSRPAPG